MSRVRVYYDVAVHYSADVDLDDLISAVAADGVFDLDDADVAGLRGGRGLRLDGVRAGFLTESLLDGASEETDASGPGITQIEPL